MRKIVVDGEKWKWAIGKVRGFSEYTPCGVRELTLQGPGGFQRSFDYDAKGAESPAVTPKDVAGFIRSIRADWP